MFPKQDQAYLQTLSDERITHVIKDVFRSTSLALQSRLRKKNILYSHWTLLRVLWRTDGLTQRQLSIQAGVTEPSTFNALVSMEKLGYIERLKVGNNKKQIRVFLTAKGNSLKNLIVPCAEDVNQIALNGISVAELNTTRKTLIAIITNLADDNLASNIKK